MSLGFTVYGIKKTPLNVLKEAGNSVLYYGRIIFASLSDLLRGRESINDLSGPVGIVTAIGQAASYGWQDLLELLVLITVNLGIFNLLPFPALDGGKVVFLAIEGITSPDGRVFGKMGHSERSGEYLYKNVTGDKYQPIFEGGVDYFKV